MTYPELTKHLVESKSTLREYIKSLGKDILYNYDRMVIGVLVNKKGFWDSSELMLGDKVVVYSIIVGDQITSISILSPLFLKAFTEFLEYGGPIMTIIRPYILCISLIEGRNLPDG